MPKRVVRRTVRRGAPAPIVMYDGLFWIDGGLAGLELTLPVPPLHVVRAGNSFGVAQDDGDVEFYFGGTDPVGEVHYTRGDVRALKGDSMTSQFAVLRRSGRLEVLTSGGENRYAIELPAASSYGDDRCYRPRCTMAELRLADFEWPYAVYVRGRAIHVVDVRSGRDLVVRRPTAGPVHAQLEVTGLSYSYGNRISYLGHFKIDDLFRR